MSFTAAQRDEARRALEDRAAQRLARREQRRARIVAALPEATRILRDEFGASAAWLLGSLDMPWFDEQSDVDIVAAGLDRSRAGEAEHRLVRLFDARVDLLSFEELAVSFADRVREEGRVMF